MLYKYLFYWFYKLFKLLFGHMPEYSSVFTLTILGMCNFLLLLTGIRTVFNISYGDYFGYIFFPGLAVIYIINHILFLSGDKANDIVKELSKKYNKKHLFRSSILIIPFTFACIVSTIVILTLGMIA